MTVDNVSAKTPCIVWWGARDSWGAGSTLRDGKVIPASRAMWIAANGPVPDDHYICHTCDNPLCINLDHLFLGTPSDNQQDAKSKGRRASKKGALNGRARLTESDVRAIRKNRNELTQQGLAGLYGVTATTIGHVVRRLTWKEVMP